MPGARISSIRPNRGVSGHFCRTLKNRQAMHLAIPPTLHHALCNLTEGLEVDLRKPCCRSFANPSRLQWPMVLSAGKAVASLLERSHLELNSASRPCRDSRGTLHAKDMARA